MVNFGQITIRRHQNPARKITLSGQVLSTAAKHNYKILPPDLPEGHGAGPVAVGLLDSSGGGRRLAGSLGGQLLPGKWRGELYR